MEFGTRDPALEGVDLGRFISVFGAPHGDFPLAGFVVLGKLEDRLI